MDTEERKPQSGVQSVEQGARILAAFAVNRGAVSLTELSRIVDMPPGKVHRYLVSLCRSGLVDQQSASSKYELGPLSLQLGLSAIGALDPVRYASDALPALRDAVGHTVLLMIWADAGPTAIRIEESGNSITMNMRVGSVLPLLNTAIGRVFLTYLPKNSTQALVDAERASMAETPSGQGSEDIDIDQITADVRARGLSGVDSQMLPNVVTIATPVFDYQGTIAAAIGTTGLKPLLDISPDGLVARELLKVTSRISDRLGFDGTGMTRANLRNATRSANDQKTGVRK